MFLPHPRPPWKILPSPGNKSADTMQDCIKNKNSIQFRRHESLNFTCPWRYLNTIIVSRKALFKVSNKTEMSPKFHILNVSVKRGQKKC